MLTLNEILELNRSQKVILSNVYGIFGNNPTWEIKPFFEKPIAYNIWKIQCSLK